MAAAAANVSPAWERFFERGVEAVFFGLVGAYVNDFVKPSPSLARMDKKLDDIMRSSLKTESRVSNIERGLNGLQIFSGYIKPLQPRVPFPYQHRRTVATTLASRIALEPYVRSFNLGRSFPTSTTSTNGWGPTYWGAVLAWFAAVRTNASAKK